MCYNQIKIFIFFLFFILFTAECYSEEWTLCDQYASYSETIGEKKKVDWEELDPSKAIPACDKLVKEFPQNIRFYALLARAQLKEKKCEEAVKNSSVAAVNGNIFAQNMMGDLHKQFYKDVVCMEKNLIQAVHWYHKAAKQGNKHSQYHMGRAYELGHGGLSKSLKKALRWYKKAAKQNHAASQTSIGTFYKEGKGGVSQDSKKALFWYLKAAEQGYADAQYKLARLYSSGVDGEDKDDEVFKWYKKAAEQKNSHACFELAQCYHYGNCTKNKNEKEAFKYYQLASDEGHVDAHNMLGFFYHNGMGTPRNYEEAYKYYKLASDKGHPFAKNNLGKQFEKGEGVELSYSLAYDYFSQSAELGNMLAQYNLGRLFQNGLGVSRNYQEALKLYRLSSDQGHLNAMIAIAKIYEEGKEVDIDVEEALRWYEKASHGNDEYEKMMESIVEKKYALANKIRLAKFIKENISGIDVLNFGNYYAILIGIDDYKDENFPKLKSAVKDAKDLANVLKNEYGFQIDLLLNATKTEIMSKITGHVKDRDKEDNILIFYAGHGHIDDRERGYWLPIDAKTNNNNYISNKISNREIEDELEAFKARHVMVIADSCYSGTLYRDILFNKEDKSIKWIKELKKERSITVMSSGDLKVQDGGYKGNSWFTGRIIKTLQNKKKYITGHDLFYNIKTIVHEQTGQMPAYKMYLDGSKGDFIFVRK